MYYYTTEGFSIDHFSCNPSLSGIYELHKVRPDQLAKIGGEPAAPPNNFSTVLVPTFNTDLYHEI